LNYKNLIRQLKVNHPVFSLQLSINMYFFKLLLFFYATLFISFLSVTSNTDLLSDLDGLNTTAMRLPDGRVSGSNNSNIFMSMNNTPSNAVNYTGEYN